MMSLLRLDGLVCGVDEAGRGPLAGPVVAAAVILDPNKPINGLNDSKKLSAKRRDQLREEICAKALPGPSQKPLSRRLTRSTSFTPACWRCSVRSTLWPSDLAAP